VDGFWSISVCNAAEYFEPNDRGAYTINNITAAHDGDGSVAVRFGGCGDGPAQLPADHVRLELPGPSVRPRAEILDGTWIFPAITTVP
jgi:hypothetical protein